MLTPSIYKLLIRSLCLVFSSLCLIGPALGQRGRLDSDTGDAGTGGKYVIQGSVFFPSGQRVDRPIRVRLFTMTRGDMTTMTDTNGLFSFRRLAPGTYTIVIDAEKEYQPVNEQINIIQPMTRGVNSPEEIIPVQIRLRPKATSEFRPEVLNANLANVPRRALEFYDQALELSQAGKNKAAIEKLNQAISEYSGFMLAFNELGVQYMRLGELEKANESLQSALKIAPEAFTPLLNHGIVLALMKRFQEAVTELRRALKNKEHSAMGHYYLGQALANLRRFDEAEEHLVRSVALGGDEMKDAHRFLGAIYSQRGDSERAIAEFEAYVRLAPNAKDAAQVRQIIRQLKGLN